MVAGFFSMGVTTEQEGIDALANFLVSTIGWSVAEDVADSGTDRDIVLTSTGEADSANGFARYIRLRGTGNYIYMYTYETFVSTAVNTGEVYDATYGRIPAPSSSTGFLLQAVADLERVVIHVEAPNGTRYMGYVGRIRPYAKATQHNYPNLVKGGQASIYDWYYSGAARNSWMRGVEGTQAHYYCIELLTSATLASIGVSDRDGSFGVVAPVLYRADGDTALSELVGEPRGVYRISDEAAAHNSFVSIGGENYIVFRTGTGDNMAVGPVTASGTAVPSLAS